MTLDPPLRKRLERAQPQTLARSTLLAPTKRALARRLYRTLTAGCSGLTSIEAS